jgi:hypothetical protein
MHLPPDAPVEGMQLAVATPLWKTCGGRPPLRPSEGDTCLPGAPVEGMQLTVSMPLWKTSRRSATSAGSAARSAWRSA